jgi:hypothetical protein
MNNDYEGVYPQKTYLVGSPWKYQYEVLFFELGSVAFKVNQLVKHLMNLIVKIWIIRSILIVMGSCLEA